MDDDSPNALLLGWVKEWWDNAKEKNTKGVMTYRGAYEALRACPLRFEHPDELMALRGFGPKLCGRLTERLAQHRAAEGLPMPKKRSKAVVAAGGRVLGEETSSSTTTTTTKPRKRKAYVPALRQGGYAIVMALSSSEATDRQWMAKADVVELAQPYCDTSFTVKPPGKFYTAWDAIKTLLNNDLVMERGRPSRRYALTEDGWAMARRFRAVAGEEAEGCDAEGGVAAPEPTYAQAKAAPLVPAGTPDDAVDLDAVRPIVLPAGSYTVQLVLDTRERVAGQRTYMEDELAKRGARPLVRPLTLGDALWVAKVAQPGQLSRDGAEGDEVVLDWLVERKRQDDLVSSIRDGRFREQKYRQRRSGVRHVVYVIEDGGLDAEGLHRHEVAMRAAVAATQVAHGCFVRRTRSVDDTIAYLARLTAALQRRYAGRALHVIPTEALTARNHGGLLERFRGEAARVVEQDHAEPDPRTPEVCITYPAFASLTAKSDSLTLRDVYLKMLMCTRGVTGERALEIQKRWRTPQALAAAYGQLTGGCDGEAARKRKRTMVSDVLGQLPGNKRRVTKALSEKLAEAWG